MQTQDWTVEIHLDEENATTHAHAVLRGREGSTLQADGTARRNPSDASVPEIGEELAAARALQLLADRLREITQKDIENLSHPLGV